MPANVAPSASTPSGTSITERQFMHGMIAMAVLVMTMIVMRVAGRLAAQSPRWPKKVMNIRRQE